MHLSQNPRSLSGGLLSESTVTPGQHRERVERAGGQCGMSLSLCLILSFSLSLTPPRPLSLASSPWHSSSVKYIFFFFFCINKYQLIEYNQKNNKLLFHTHLLEPYHLEWFLTTLEVFLQFEKFQSD